jgi:ribose 5-phosphate isomerase A
VKTPKGDEVKKQVGYRAADLVEDGMVVGLGTGSTVYYTLERLAARIQDGFSIQGIPTSLQTAMRARALGIPLTDLEERPVLDMAIDGADQVDRYGYLVKGRGGAHTREKIVADAAACLVIIVTPDKLCERLTAPIPVEVIPFAWSHVSQSIARLGGLAQIRESEKGKDGPVISDNGNLILDADFGEISNPPQLETLLGEIPGVIGSGLFTRFTSKTRVITGDRGSIREISYQ